MLDPNDPVTQQIDDEFLIGNTTLVAPVLQLGQRQRNVYLPRLEGMGEEEEVIWKRGSDGRFFKGGQWLNDTKVLTLLDLCCPGLVSIVPEITKNPCSCWDPILMPKASN